MWVFTRALTRASDDTEYEARWLVDKLNPSWGWAGPHPVCLASAAREETGEPTGSCSSVKPCSRHLTFSRLTHRPPTKKWPARSSKMWKALPALLWTRRESDTIILLFVISGASQDAVALQQGNPGAAIADIKERLPPPCTYNYIYIYIEIYLYNIFIYICINIYF